MGGGQHQLVSSRLYLSLAAGSAEEKGIVHDL